MSTPYQGRGKGRGMSQASGRGRGRNKPDENKASSSIKEAEINLHHMEHGMANQVLLMTQ